jgi:hypothetical protein
MEKIPFAENLAQHLPGSYNKNLSTLNETQTKAMHEDERELTKANAMIRTWLDGLAPKAYQDDMRRRINRLREKHK